MLFNIKLNEMKNLIELNSFEDLARKILSVRAQNVLLSINVRTIEKLSVIDKSTLLKCTFCSNVIADEILSFYDTITEKFF